MRVSKYKHLDYNNVSFLAPDFVVEVHMQGIDKEDCIYQMVVHEVNRKEETAMLFFPDDSKQILYNVSLKEIGPVLCPMRESIFSVDQKVEVRYRVDTDSPWGWWNATIKECLYMNNSINVTHYNVVFTDGSELVVPIHDVRLCAFL